MSNGGENPVAGSGAVTESAERLGRSSKWQERIVTAVACIAALWAALLLVGYAIGDGSQSLAGALGLSALCAAYAVALFTRNARALGLSWTMVVLFGLATILGGIVPLMLGLWGLLLWFTIYLRKHPQVLGPKNRHVDQSAV